LFPYVHNLVDNYVDNLLISIRVINMSKQYKELFDEELEEVYEVYKL
jgi:hypothetical protein